MGKEVRVARGKGIARVYGVKDGQLRPSCMVFSARLRCLVACEYRTQLRFDKKRSPNVEIRIVKPSTFALICPLRPFNMAFPGGGMPMGLPGGRTAVMSEQQLQEQRMVKMVRSMQARFQQDLRD